jgi:hypothetical protein
MVALIRKYGANDFDKFSLATVTSAAPFRIKVDGMVIELEAEDVVIAEHLTAHERLATIGGSPVTIAFDGALSTNDHVIIASMNSGQLYVILDKVGVI